MTELTIVTGSIARISATALLTTTHPDERIAGQVDAAIRSVADNYFHSQVRRVPRPDNKTVIHASGGLDTAFASVLFVIDDWSSPLWELVQIGLLEAERLSLGTVSIPLLRTGAARGVHEETPREAVMSLLWGVRNFLDTKPSRVERIVVVAYNNHTLQSQAESLVRSF